MSRNFMFNVAELGTLPGVIREMLLLCYKVFLSLCCV